MIRPLHKILSPADIASLANAVCGLLAILVSLTSPTLAARLLLIAAIADGLDGILARQFGGSSLGVYLDGLSDVVSFGVAPAVIVSTLVLEPGPLTLTTVALVGAVSLYVGMALVRLAIYTDEDSTADYTTGVPTTLAATVLAISILSNLATPGMIVGMLLVMSGLMITDFRYPDLRTRDALAMGVVQAVVIVSPTLLNHGVLWILASSTTAYLVLGPRFYRRSLSLETESSKKPTVFSD